ncbi:MAG: hypothetical protein NUV67_01595 [archaeon]|nr:hypothetical protein [archaeon]
MAIREIRDFFASLSASEKFAIAAILLFVFLFFNPVIVGDGFGYYATLEGVARYNSLDLEHGARFNEIAKTVFVDQNPRTGQYYSKYSPGLSLFSIPLYAVSLFLDDFEIFHIKDALFLERGGDILVRMIALPLTSSLFFLAGLFVTIIVLRKFFSQKETSLALLIAFFSTPIIWWATYGASYSHAMEAGLFALLVFFVLQKKENPYLVGAAIGLLAITRYTNGIFILPFLVHYFLRGEYQKIKGVLLGFAPFVIGILVYFQIQFGNPFTSGYENGFFPLPIFIFHILVDPSRGILFWTPTILVSIAGLYYLRHEKKFLLMSLFFLNLLVYSAWHDWHSAWSFGNRFFAHFFILYCLGTAALLKYKSELRWLVYFAAIYGFVLAVLFFAQVGFVSEPFDFVQTVQYWLSDGNIFSLPEKFFNKVSLVRFVTET